MKFSIFSLFQVLNEAGSTENTTGQRETLSSTQEVEKDERISKTKDYTVLNEVETESMEISTGRHETVSSTQEIESDQRIISKTHDTVLNEGGSAESSFGRHETLSSAQEVERNQRGLNKSKSSEKSFTQHEILSDSLASDQIINPKIEDVTGLNYDSKKERLVLQIQDVTVLMEQIEGMAELPLLSAETWLSTTAKSFFLFARTAKSFLLKAGSAEWIFLIISFVLEIFSAICEQLSSRRKPEYALIGVSLASVALATCVCELIVNFNKGKVESERPGGSSSDIFPHIFGLICGFCQWLSSIARFVCIRMNKENPFKVNILPVIFLGCWGVVKLNNKRCITKKGIHEQLTSVVLVPSK